MDRDRVVDFVAALDESEWAQLVAEARGTDPATDARLRAAETAGDWRESMRLKNEQLRKLMNPKG